MLRSTINTILAASLLSSGIAFAAETGDGGGAAPVPVTETKTVIKQNGIKRPDAGSVTGTLWDIADRISEDLGRPAPRADVVKQYLEAVPNGNQATANTQYARWVTFHGVSAILRDARAAETAERRDAKNAEKQAAKTAAEEAKAAKVAADAEAKQAKAAEAEAKKAEKEAEKQRKRDEKEAAKAAKIASAAAAAPAQNAPAE